MSPLSIDKLKAAYASATDGDEVPEHSNVHEYIERYYIEFASMREWLTAFVCTHIFGVLDLQDPSDKALLRELHYEVEDQMHERVERLVFRGNTFATIRSTPGHADFTVANEVMCVLK